MPLTTDDVNQVAHLARINISDQETNAYVSELTKILELIAEMEKVDTTDVIPMAHPLDISQALRPDVVTETDQRELFQANAPATEAGLYLVPQVIE